MLKTLLFYCATVFAQDSGQFVSPREKFDQASQLESEDDYPAAIDLYLSISENDTSYIEAQYLLMSAYNAQEEYQKSIDIGKRLKDTPSDFNRGIFITLGNAYLNTDRRDSAIITYEEGLEHFPYQHTLIYNIGYAYYTMGEYEKAIPYFQRSAKINPFYSSNHVLLGYLSMLQGHVTKAYLSYLTYMAIEPSDNNILVFLENLSGQNVRKFGSIEPFDSNETFQKYDDLILSGAALDGRFERKVDFNASIVKQQELLFSRIKYEENTDDFWMDFYVPFYQELQESGLTTAFVYYMLQSSNNDPVLDWIKKHDDDKSAWVKLANKRISSNRLRDTTTVLGVKDTYSFWYYGTNEIHSIGNQREDETPYGPWIFFHKSGRTSAEGRYTDEGVKTGEWNYFHENGRLQRREMYNDEGHIVEPRCTTMRAGQNQSLRTMKESN